MMKYKIRPYTIQELGQRQNQEDSIYPSYGQSSPADRLFILCDGMGGHEKGEVASAAVCEAMSQTILNASESEGTFSDEQFQMALSSAFNALDVRDNGGEKKMGTTMTFLKLHSGGATIAHIGDSRVYQFRPAQNGQPARVMFKTQDHSLVNDLIRIGELTEEEAKTFPQKNVITRAMQPHQERRVKADIAHITDIKPGDWFFLCSDGMLEVTEDENLLFIITKEDSLDEDKVEMLRKVTAENKDNHTAHLIHIIDVEVDSVSQEKSVATERVGISVDTSRIERINDRKVLTTPIPKRRRLKRPVVLLLKIVLLLILFGTLTIGIIKFVMFWKGNPGRKTDEKTLIHTQRKQNPGKVEAIPTDNIKDDKVPTPEQHETVGLF